ncbi:hypothetical protein M2311_006926, partial [Rhizobium leguminosarum]|nr:hypothetical protein [Rhizobium leguminosarum]
MATGIPPGTSEPIAFDPGGKMPGPPAALLRHAKQWVRPAILSLADLP